VRENLGHTSSFKGSRPIKDAASLNKNEMNARKFLLVATFIAIAAGHSSAQTGAQPLIPNDQSPETTNSGCPIAEDGESIDCTSTGYPNGSSGGFGLNSAYPGLGSAGSYSRNSYSVYRDTAGELESRRAGEQSRLYAAQPQPLTEFQILVAGSVGHIVPIYGADLFADVPETFAPVQRIPVTPDYMIGPGDEILIRAWGQINQNLELTVDRSGSIYIPQVGSVRVAGLPFSQLQDFLKSHYAYVFRNFDLNVNLGQLRSIQVFLTGDARRPGSYTISSLSTLVNAVFACGGPAIEGSMRHIQLRRGSTLVTDFDLYDLLLHGDKSKDVPLQSGDVIYFPPAGSRVAVLGSVRLPAIYELRGAETVAQALALAGGVSAVANESSLEIERTENQSTGYSARVAMDVAMDKKGMALALEDADIVRVRARPPRFAETVTLRGNVANPGRFAWHEGMRIRDLIPDQESLLTHDYWLRREQLGLPVADFQPLLPPLISKAPLETRPSNGPSLRTPVRPQDAQAVSSGLFPQLTQGVPVDTQSSAGNHAQFGPIAESNEPVAGAAAGQAEQAANSSNTSEALGNTPGTLGVGSRLVTTPQFPIATQVVRMTPNIDWSYAVVERVDPQTFTTRLIPFNLGAVVIDHDESADFNLEPGDTITVFSDADIRVPRAQQTKYVRLEGEFIHAGVYSALPGETLRHLVIRAGGLTDQAYLYGSQFTRESTRREQQQRLDEYVAALSFQMQITGSNLAASVVSPQQAATAGASEASQRELVSRLHELRATGRIVLHINPLRPTIDSLPDIPLEDGDRFVVPPIPSTVGVVGSVYDPNSFVYLPRHDAASYLKTSGGPNRNADRRQMFIVRADGSVVSRQYLSHTLWESDEFDRQPVYPGDTIVVPTSVNKTTLLRGLTDWSQVFSQFGLGAAAIEILK
jgi:protein involved in polysaccharide export with SLBB domain